MRPLLLVVAGILLLAAAGLATYRYILPHVDLRVTTGVSGGPANRLVGAFTAAMAVQHPRVRIQPVQVPDLAASAKAIETNSADLAIIRTDAAVPSNGATIAILRRDVVALVVPAKSSIDKFSGLANETVGLVQGPAQDYNSKALDTLLSYYDIPAHSVRRVFLPLEQVGHALAERRIAAILAIGPIGPGEVVDVVSAVMAARKGAPKIIGVDEADAVNKRFPAFESIDVPAGAFRGRPPIPDDTVTTVSVSYRFVASNSMFDIVAGAIAQAIFTAKTRLMQLTPVAAQIEAPDPDDKNPVLPVHPGVAAYLNNGEQSFFDEFQQYIYMGAMGLSAVGSVTALVIGQLSRRKSRAELMKMDELIGIADRALKTRSSAEIDALEATLNDLVGWFVKKHAAGGENSSFSVAIAHARYAIERQRAAIWRSDHRDADERPRPTAPGDVAAIAPAGAVSAHAS